MGRGKRRLGQVDNQLGRASVMGQGLITSTLRPHMTILRSDPFPRLGIARIRLKHRALIRSAHAKIHGLSLFRFLKAKEDAISYCRNRAPRTATTISFTVSTSGGLSLPEKWLTNNIVTAR